MRKNKINIAILSIIFTCVSPLLAANTEVATFACGCFWSMQHDFDKIPGVIKTTVGYTGGTLENPTYEQVSAGNTGHYEAIEVVYDPSTISYQRLVNYFWHDIDPSDATGQFCDHGNEYHSAIFYNNAKQQNIAIESKHDLLSSRRFNDVATIVMPVRTFYPAEAYHQKYAEKNPQAYDNYRTGCGRDARTKEIWGSVE
jgi:peptide-methionine (S)-S-oxide reductase